MLLCTLIWLWHSCQFPNNPNVCCLLLWFPYYLPGFECPVEKFYSAAGRASDRSLLNLEATCPHLSHHPLWASAVISFFLFYHPAQYLPQLLERSFKKNKLDYVPSLLKTTPLASQGIELFFNMILKAIANLSCDNSPRSFSLLVPNCFQSSHPLAFFLLSFFVHTIFHLWRPLPYKLLYLMPTHLARLWSMLFLLNTLLFSLWGFYSKHVAQPVINYL